MRQQIKIIFTIAVWSIFMTGCQMNNGDIGDLYGTWAVEKVEVDGQIYNGWRDAEWIDSFFQFQNNICFVSRTTKRLDQETRTCTWFWVSGENEIALDFTHSDYDFPNTTPDSYLYGAPGWLLLEGPAVIDFRVIWNGSKNMVWTTVNTQGETLKYYLRKVL